MLCMKRKFFSGLTMALLLVSCQKQSAINNSDEANRLSVAKSEIVYHPDVDIPELFARVQTEMIYADSKTFVDAIPKQKPADILKQYAAEKDRVGFDLKAFVEQHFELPPALPVTHVNNETNMLDHLNAHWVNLVRNPQKTSEYSTLVQLPHPYVVPGGRFREMFYWDSYFTIVGLLQSNQDQLAKDMIDNFAYLIDKYGHIPNGNRTYFLTRSQPPFFALMLKSYAAKHGTDSIIGYLPQLEKEYSYWMDHVKTIPAQATTGDHLIVLNNGDYLNRYFGALGVPRAEGFNKELKWAQEVNEKDRKAFYENLRAACESGWDFSSRWYADGKTKPTINAMDLIPVDLSSLLYSLESTLAELNLYKHQQDRADFYNKRAQQRKQFIQTYHYDAVTGTYQDYNFVTGKRTGHLSIAMVFPLFVNAATPEAAKRVTTYINEKLLMPGGVVTTLVASGEQWDYPNGWAPMQYIAVEGLLQYNEKPLALEIAKRWLALNERVYREDGKMMEKYNVVDTHIKAGGGNYPNQDGFGWTNGVDIAFYHLLQKQQ